MEDYAKQKKEKHRWPVLRKWSRNVTNPRKQWIFLHEPLHHLRKCLQTEYRTLYFWWWLSFPLIWFNMERFKNVFKFNLTKKKKIWTWIVHSLTRDTTIMQLLWIKISQKKKPAMMMSFPEVLGVCVCVVGSVCGRKLQALGLIAWGTTGGEFDCRRERRLSIDHSQKNLSFPRMHCSVPLSPPAWVGPLLVSIFIKRSFFTLLLPPLLVILRSHQQSCNIKRLSVNHLYIFPPHLKKKHDSLINMQIWKRPHVPSIASCK